MKFGFVQEVRTMEKNLDVGVLIHVSAGAFLPIADTKL